MRYTDFEYYYYKDKQIPLQLNTGSIYVATQNAANVRELSNIIGNDYEVVLGAPDYTPQILNRLNSEKGMQTAVFKAEIKVKGSTTEAEYLSFVKQLKNISGVLYAAPCFVNSNGYKVDISHLFYVKLKSQADLNELQAMARQTKTAKMRPGPPRRSPPKTANTNRARKRIFGADYSGY